MANGTLKVPHEDLPLERIRALLLSELERLTQSYLRLKGSEDAELVHSFRKLAKASRAHLRLLRDYVSAAEFQDFDATIGALARTFAAARETNVREQSLQSLIKSEHITQQAVDALTPYLERAAPPARVVDLQANGAATGLVGEDGALSRLCATLQSEPLRLLHDGESVSTQAQERSLKRQLRKTYSKGRHRLERASGSDVAPPLLHDFRKQVKHHANQIAVLQGSEALRARRRLLMDLADLLGEHHDLFDLECCLISAAAESTNREIIDTVVTVARVRRQELETQAFKLAQRLYKRKPRRTTRWVLRHWEQQASA